MTGNELKDVRHWGSTFSDYLIVLENKKTDNSFNF